MEYLPQTIWRQSDRERAKAMIQAIDKQLKSRRIMRSLERFVGGRPHGPSDAKHNPPLPLKNIRVISFTMKMEILLEPTSNKLMVDPHGFEGYIKMAVKLKNFKKDATLKLFKSTNQERYEHVGPEVTSSQGGKVNKMAKQDYA
ncbi:hypothetical protein Tco_1326320 [Tanacetum coccineum]